MLPAASRRLGNIVLIVAIVILLVELAGMLEIIPKYVPPTPTMLFVMVLASLASALRRRGRGPA